MKSRIAQTILLTFLAVTVVYAEGRSNRRADNPFQNSGTARAAGQKLFARHCAECHGEAAEGTDRAPGLRPFARSAGPRELQSFIKKGNLRTGMPSWSRLPDQRLWQIVTYLQSLPD
jgi:cytochrome c oxidase cbb3-type subunit II